MTSYYCKKCPTTKEMEIRKECGVFLHWVAGRGNTSIKYWVEHAFCGCGHYETMVPRHLAMARAVQADVGVMQPQEVHSVANRIGIERHDLAWALDSVGTSIDNPNVTSFPPKELDLRLRTLLFQKEHP